MWYDMGCKEVLVLAVTRAQMKAVQRYETENYDKILLRVRKGERDAIQDAAERAGKSMNRFIVDAVLEAVKPLEGAETENAEM